MYPHKLLKKVHNYTNGDKKMRINIQFFAQYKYTLLWEIAHLHGQFLTCNTLILKVSLACALFCHIFMSNELSSQFDQRDLEFAPLGGFG